MPVIPSSSNPASIAAAEIRANALAAYRHLANVFATEARRFWAHPAATPAEIAAALGTDAVEVFTLHGAIGRVLAAIDPESVAAASALVRPFTYHEDGTVTIDAPPPAPADDLEPTSDPTPDA